MNESGPKRHLVEEIPTRLDGIESQLKNGSKTVNAPKQAWDNLFAECLACLGERDAKPLQTLAEVCLNRRAEGQDVCCGWLIDSCLDRSQGKDEDTGTAVVVQVCLDRLRADDEVAWAVLQEFTFAQVIKKCELIIRSKVTRNNPVITENGLAADVYLRLDKAMREKKSAVPTTAREYFGLAARNIRWQITDLLRKPKNDQEEAGIFLDLAQSTGVSTETLNLEVWSKFWLAVAELPEEQREVFDLIWINELSQYETAEQLGLKRDRVKDLWRSIKIKIAEECVEVLPHLGPLG